MEETVTDKAIISGITRRSFIAGSAATAGLMMAGTILPGTASAAGPLTLPPLPYPENALDPYISSRTLGFHYGKHHQGYLDKTNAKIAGTPLEGEPLETIILKAAADPGQAGLFNVAAQTWNHTFYWRSMRPGGGGKPQGKLAEALEKSFGSFDRFKETFVESAATLFGSGWAFLVSNQGRLEVVQTSNADTPIAHGQVPILTVDVWEHAYYLDYQNRRKDYLDVYLDKLVNWEFASENFARV